jgi:hypothetical protein
MSVQTKDVIFELLKNTENGMMEFQRWLNLELHRQILTVVFTKKDGTERTMRCTLNSIIIPESSTIVKIDETHEPGAIRERKVTRKPSPDVRTCYDVDSGAWKSFRWDSIKSVTYNDSEVI